MEAVHLPQFGLEVDRGRAGAVLRVSGELDLATVSCLTDGVARLWQEGTAPVALDLGRVSFVDWASLVALLELFRDALIGGHELVVTRSCDALERLIALVWADDAKVGA